MVSTNHFQEFSALSLLVSTRTSCSWMQLLVELQGNTFCSCGASFSREDFVEAESLVAVF